MLDENLPSDLADNLSSRGHDVDTVADEGLSGEGDATVLTTATQHERVIMTLDRGFGDVRIHPPGSHPGIVVLRSLWRPAELVRELAAATPTNVTADAKELPGFIETLADAGEVPQTRRLLSGSHAPKLVEGQDPRPRPNFATFGIEGPNPILLPRIPSPGESRTAPRTQGNTGSPADAFGFPRCGRTPCGRPLTINRAATTCLTLLEPARRQGHQTAHINNSVSFGRFGLGDRAVTRLVLCGGLDPDADRDLFLCSEFRVRCRCVLV